MKRKIWNAFACYFERAGEGERNARHFYLKKGRTDRGDASCRMKKTPQTKILPLTPSVTRREKATVVRGEKAVRIRTGEGKGGCRDCAGKRERRKQQERQKKRDTASLAEGQAGAAATDEWQSVRGDTQHPDIRQPYLQQSGKTDGMRHHVPENAPERGRKKTACSRDGRMWRVHSRMRIAPSSQESEGCSGNCTERSNYAGTGSTRPVSAMAANEEHAREAAQAEPRMNREEHIPSEPSGAVPVVAGTNPEQESRSDRPPADIQQLDSGQEVSGILEMVEGYGFLRRDNYMPGENDIYVSPSQIRRFNLKTGDIVCGNTRIKTMQEKYSALLYLKSVNGMPPSEATRRYNFEDMTPVFPDERLCMERGSRAIAMRIVDLFSPIGRGTARYDRVTAKGRKDHASKR